jgi:hypothetical protein
MLVGRGSRKRLRIADQPRIVILGFDGSSFHRFGHDRQTGTDHLCGHRALLVG